LKEANINDFVSNIKGKITMVKLLQDEEATDTAKFVFNDIKQTFGMIPNLFKAIAAADPCWLEMNWYREKKIMIEEGPLDRKTRELIAFAVSVINNCEYCSLAHEKMARMQGASEEEINHARQVIELFASFNAIANSFPDLPCDIKP